MAPGGELRPAGAVGHLCPNLRRRAPGALQRRHGQRLQRAGQRRSDAFFPTEPAPRRAAGAVSEGGVPTQHSTASGVDEQPRVPVRHAGPHAGSGFVLRRHAGDDSLQPVAVFLDPGKGLSAVRVLVAGDHPVHGGPARLCAEVSVARLGADQPVHSALPAAAAGDSAVPVHLALSRPTGTLPPAGAAAQRPGGPGRGPAAGGAVRKPGAADSGGGAGDPGDGFKHSADRPAAHPGRRPGRAGVHPGLAVLSGRRRSPWPGCAFWSAPPPCR